MKILLKPPFSLPAPTPKNIISHHPQPQGSRSFCPQVLYPCFNKPRFSTKEVSRILSGSSAPDFTLLNLPYIPKPQQWSYKSSPGRWFPQDKSPATVPRQKERPWLCHKFYRYPPPKYGTMNTSMGTYSQVCFLSPQYKHNCMPMSAPNWQHSPAKGNALTTSPMGAGTCLCFHPALPRGPWKSMP